MMIFTFVCLRVKRDIGLPRFSLMGRLASRVDNTLRGRETRYLHASSRRRSDPINFHLNRACLKNSSLRILVERQTFCLEDDHPFEHHYPSVSTLRERIMSRNEVVLNGNSKNIRKEGLKEACKGEIQDKSGRTRVRLA